MPPDPGFHIDTNSIDGMIGWLLDQDAGYEVRSPRGEGDTFEFTFRRGLSEDVMEFKTAIEGYRWLVARANGARF